MEAYRNREGIKVITVVGVNGNTHSPCLGMSAEGTLQQMMHLLTDVDIEAGVHAGEDDAVHAPAKTLERGKR